MPIPFICPHCQQPGRAPDHGAGKRLRCPACRQLLIVPLGPAPQPAPTVVVTSNGGGGASGFLVFIVFLLGLSLGGVVGYMVGSGDLKRLLSGGEQQAGGKDGPGKGDGVPAGDPDREQFLAIVRKNADDPGGLEIVTWGERQKDFRAVRFRCNRVGPIRTGKAKLAGPPVSLEDATLKYEGAKITEVYLEKTFQFWHPR